jgi:hypothetical protein
MLKDLAKDSLRELGHCSHVLTPISDTPCFHSINLRRGLVDYSQKWV